MNALINMMVEQSEGSEKTTLIRHGKSTGKQNNEISEDGCNNGGGIGAQFSQILEHISAGGGKSGSDKPEQRLLSCTESSDTNKKDENRNLASAGTVKRRIFHEVGKSKSHGTEVFDTDGSDKNTKKNTQGTVDTTPFSKNGIKGGNEEGKTVVLRYSGQQNLKEELDIQTSTNHQQNDVNGKVTQKTGIHFLNGAPETADNQATAQLAKTVSGDEKSAAVVRQVRQEQKTSVFRETGETNFKKDNSEASIMNLSDNEDVAVSGKQNTSSQNNARNLQTAVGHADKNNGTAEHASASKNMSGKMAEVPVTQKIKAAYAEDSQRFKIVETETGRLTDNQSPEQQMRGSEKTQGKMKQQFMARENTTQTGDNVRGSGDFDGLNDNEQRMKEFPREIRLTDRTLEVKHSVSGRIEAQTTTNGKNHETLNIKSHDIINQVANAVQTKASKGFGRVKIELNPPHLGTIDLDVLVRDNKVHVVLRAEQYDVRQLLQSHSDVLKTALNTHGLVTEAIDVSLNDQMDGNVFQFDRDGRLFDGRQQSSSGGEKKKNEETSTDVSSTTEYTGIPSVETNGQISLFA